VRVGSVRVRGRCGQDFSNFCGCGAAADKKIQPAQDSSWQYGTHKWYAIRKSLGTTALQIQWIFVILLLKNGVHRMLVPNRYSQAHHQQHQNPSDSKIQWYPNIVINVNGSCIIYIQTPQCKDSVFVFAIHDAKLMVQQANPKPYHELHQHEGISLQSTKLNVILLKNGFAKPCDMQCIRKTFSKGSMKDWTTWLKFLELIHHFAFISWA